MNLVLTLLHGWLLACYSLLRCSSQIAFDLKALKSRGRHWHYSARGLRFIVVMHQLEATIMHIRS